MSWVESFIQTVNTAYTPKYILKKVTYVPGDLLDRTGER